MALSTLLTDQNSSLKESVIHIVLLVFSIHVTSEERTVTLGTSDAQNYLILFFSNQ